MGRNGAPASACQNGQEGGLFDDFMLLPPSGAPGMASRQTGAWASWTFGLTQPGRSYALPRVWPSRLLALPSTQWDGFLSAQDCRAAGSVPNKTRLF